MLGFLMMSTLMVCTYSNSIECQIKSNSGIDGLIKMMVDLASVYDQFHNELLTVRLVLK